MKTEGQKKLGENLPCHEKLFIQLVIDIYNDIVISGNIDKGAGKLPINCYNLQSTAMRSIKLLKCS